MATETVNLMVKGGAATAGPPLGPALAGKGVNIGQIVKDINEKTKPMAGMDVPVKVKVDLDAKQYTIEVGMPPSTALLKKEAGLESGSGTAGRKHVGVLRIQHLIKIAKMKTDSTLANDLKSHVKELAGTCVSLGIKVEGKNPRNFQKELMQGIYDKIIKSEITELTEEESAQWQEMKEVVAKEIEEFEKATAQAVAATQAAEQAAASTTATAAGAAPAAGAAAEGAPGSAMTPTAVKAASPAKAEKKKPARKLKR